MRASKIAAAAAVIPLVLVGMASAAMADNIQDTIADTGTGVSLVAGSGTSASGAIRLIGNSSAGDTDPGCNIDAGDAALVLDIVTPTGVTASPDPLRLTSCGTEFSVAFTASSAAQSGAATVTVLSGPAGGGTYVNQVYIPITVTQPLPTNTKPSVSISGVSDGASYEVGSAPSATCNVTDAEDGSSQHAATVTGTLSHGLGSQTATCTYTDAGGLAADTTTATYAFVDTGDPTIEHSLDPGAANANGWYNRDVTVTFACADSGSGVKSCLADGGSTHSKTLGEGANQSVSGTATDWADNTSTDTTSGINIDKTKPHVSLSGGPVDGASYYFGSVPAAPGCVASDALSGIDGSCSVSGGGAAVGTHTYATSASDLAGNSSSASATYTVLAWNLKGFYAPVDMSGVLNTVKGGSAVPLKFEVFAGSTELNSTTDVQSFKTQKISCSTGSGTEDAIEILSTGGTSLRYDSTGGQFIQNWKTPTGAGNCYSATVTTIDGSSITSLFKIK